MSDIVSTFDDWITQADIPAVRLTDAVRALLQAAFRFTEQQGRDYCSRRLLCHLLDGKQPDKRLEEIRRYVGFVFQSLISGQNSITLRLYFYS